MRSVQRRFIEANGNRPAVGFCVCGRQINEVKFAVARSEHKDLLGTRRIHVESGHITGCIDLENNRSLDAPAPAPGASMTVKAELALPTAGIACGDSAENWAARFAETANDDETAMSPLTSKTRRCDTLTPSNILFTPLTARVGWRTTVAGLRLIRHYPKSASIACLISSSATTAQDRADSSRNPWPKLAGRHKTQTGQRIHAER